LDGIMIRSLDLEKSKTETLAGAYRDNCLPPAESKTFVNQMHTEKLKEWVRSGEIVLKKPDTELAPHLRSLIPSGLDGNIMIAPLQTEHSSYGIVLIYTKKTQPILLEHKNILKELIQPFSTALNNHQRLEEIKKLKEAAEADRFSLMSRFGRAEIGD